jgi:dihydropteroate synthase
MHKSDSRDQSSRGAKPVSTRPVDPKHAQNAAPTVPVRRARSHSVRCGPISLPLGRIPLIVGILNVTPDSFSDGGRFADPDAAVAQALAMWEAGAGVIDIGGESTRPGSESASAGQELDRVLPVIDALTAMRQRGSLEGVPISIDTRKAEVADVALRRGCHVVNDVSAVSDPEMVEVLRGHPNVPIILMHMKGDPRTMQEAPRYDDVVGEVAGFLDERAETLVRSHIERDRIIVDPGIGFGKRFRDNLELLNRIDSLRALGYPVLIGASRKRFLGELLDAGPDGRLPGSLAVAAHCVQRGVEFVRVHDVRETAEIFRVLDAVLHPDDYEADW